VLVQLILLAAVALVAALAAAYLLGEWRGSRGLYEPLPPTDLRVAPTDELHSVGHLEHSVVVELIPQITAREVEELDVRLGQVSEKN
jgi:hypothetical protein